MIVTVDTGGTKTLIAGFDHDGKIAQEVRFPTPENQDEYVVKVTETLQATYKDIEVEAIVIALPGIVKNGIAVWCNNLGWKNFKAEKAFTGVLGNTPVFIENDANLAGLAEARALVPIPVSVLYVTISTGIGTGVITAGRIDPGLRLSEGGRTMVEFEGALQEWESFASGKAIVRDFGAKAEAITDQTSWDQIADRISRGFLAMTPVIQPDVVIIGGSVGAYFDRFKIKLEAILKHNLPLHIPCPHFREAKHPEEAVVYGCYYYAVDYLATL